MAGYRPKSLDDINQSYDSEMKVTRAIKRETSRLSQSAPSVADVFSEPKPEETNNELMGASDSDNPKKIEDLSFAVEDFIKQISGQNPSDVRKSTFESKHDSPTPVAPTPERPAQPISHKEEPTHTASASENQFVPGVRTPIATQTIPDPSKGRSEDDFSSLMSDYVRIMNDLDDETPKKKGFMSRKKNKKKALQKEFAAEVENESSEEDLLSQADEQHQTSQNNDQSDDSDTISEEIYEETEKDESSVESSFEENDNSSDNDNDDDYYGSFADLFEEDCEADDKSDENLDEAAFEEEKEQKPKRSKEKKAKKSKTDAKADKPKGKHNGARIFFRVIFSLILVVSTLSTLAVGSTGIVFHINEGVCAPGNIYLFTASRDFEQTEVNSGDLVVCKAKNSADDGQSVVYVDRENKTFSFGVKNGSITGSDGEIYYIIDDNTIMRENVLGSVDKTIPTAGKIIGIIYSYYIFILVALLVLSIALFLIVTVALRNRNKLTADEEEFDGEFDLIQEDEDSLEEVPEEEPTDDENATFDEE